MWKHKVQLIDMVIKNPKAEHPYQIWCHFYNLTSIKIPMSWFCSSTCCCLSPFDEMNKRCTREQRCNKPICMRSSCSVPTHLIFTWFICQLQSIAHMMRTQTVQRKKNKEIEDWWGKRERLLWEWVPGVRSPIRY